MKKERKIPTIVGLFVLLVSIVAGIFFTGRRVIFSPKASGDCSPINPQVTNTTNNSFDISFITSGICTSSIIIDNRTIPNFRESSKIHYFQVNNLRENTVYSFSFLNNGSLFSQEGFKGETGKNPKGKLPSSNLAWGKILGSDGKPTGDAIVYLNIPGASPLSSFVTTNGNWNISLASSFNDLKDDWFVPKDNTSEDIIIISPDKITQVTGNTSNSNPVPDITIGNDFLPTGIISGQNQNGFLASVSPGSISKILTIENPKEGEFISTKRPDFFGNASPNSQISIRFEVSDVTGNTTSDSSGVWHWSPSADLSIGEHLITISESSNGQNSVSRRFTVVLDSGSLSFNATPSAIISTPTPVPSPTLAPTPTTAPTIRIAKPSTGSGVPVTGIIFPTVFSLAFAFGLIIFSFLIFNKKSNF